MTDQNLFVDAPGIATYSAHAATSAAHLAAAAGHARAASPESLVPVFGLIGGEFLDSYRTVLAAHVGAITKLSNTVGSMGAAAATTGITFDRHDDAQAGVLEAAWEQD